MAKEAPKDAPKEAPKKSVKKTGGMDKFAVFVPIVIVVLLAGSLGLYFFTHTKTAYVSRENYLALPQTSHEENGQVVRMQVTLQVKSKDEEWLKKNKPAILEIYKISIKEIEPETFRTARGREAVQQVLMEEFNSKLHTDKIEAVLYNDLLVQNKVD